MTSETAKTWPVGEGTEWFWAIVDRFGLGNVPSDEVAALRLLCDKAERYEALASTARAAAGDWRPTDKIMEISRKRLRDIQQAWVDHHDLDEGNIAFLLRMAGCYLRAAPAVPASPISTGAEEGRLTAAETIAGLKGRYPDPAEQAVDLMAALGSLHASAHADMETPVEHIDRWANTLRVALSPHQGPETGGQGAGREGEGRDPGGSDYSAEPEPARGLGPLGEYSSRIHPREVLRWANQFLEGDGDPTRESFRCVRDALREALS